ncbi:MAG: hypothetical protein JST01_24675 [Cyanobacteria bacterium SZAS TMP-1]|nr:hypothetical protein [Cyanobacteria bacterium SZAS TMP-1]
MSKSKIVIALVSSTYNKGNNAVLAEICTRVKEAGGISLIASGDYDAEGIDTVLGMADGVILVAPAVFTEGQAVEVEDAFVRMLGRKAIEYGTCPLQIIGAREFFASEQEWKDWAYFYGITAHCLDLDGSVESVEALARFVAGAPVRASFMHLARGGRNRSFSEIKSPVTHG